MNDLDLTPALKTRPRQPQAPQQWPEIPEPLPHPSGPRAAAGRRLLGVAVFGVIVAMLAFGVWQHFQQHRDGAAAAEQEATFAPSVRVERVTQRQGRIHLSLPGTTLAFEQADIFARTTGYVLKRYVDIGDRVKAGQLLAEITAPEVDDQIAQFQSTLAQAQETQHQNEVNRALAQVTTMRSSLLTKQGWTTQQQGDTDRFNFEAQQHAAQAAQYNTAATQPQLKYTNHTKLTQTAYCGRESIVVSS